MKTEHAMPSQEPATVDIENVMHDSYMEYSMSVIVSRALPDVRDGLKPVHRRILYSMHEQKAFNNKPYRKSAKTVGDVMGEYHPHGDSAIYDAMARMAQPFSMRLPTVDGQGNFGSIDGDSPAAMRYTEARMAISAQDMVRDIEKNTVNMRPNYDNSGEEPVVLPTRIPSLLINGGSGIAVGMATMMPTHNPTEAIDACLHVLDNPDATLADIMKIMPAPDFPTGGIIRGTTGVRKAYETGRGSITVSGVTEIQERKGGKSRIVISELPYQTNKANFIEKIAELVKEGRITGITDINDLSDRNQEVNIEIDVRRDADPNLVLNSLRKNTDLVTSFSVNSVCLDTRGRPTMMPLMRQINEFVDFRKEVVRRRAIHDLDKARADLHKQIALYAAVTRVDDVVNLIKSSPDDDTARVRLMEMDFPTEGDFGKLLLDADPDIEEEADVPSSFRLTAEQANSILSLTLRRLTGMERDRIASRARELSAEIDGYLRILNNVDVLVEVVRNELMEVRGNYADERRTRIEITELDRLSDEDLIERKDLVLTTTNSGYVKTTPLDAYREQKRGGKGKSGMETKDGDFVTRAVSCSTHSHLIFFTSRGIAHALRAFELPEAAAKSRGRPLINYMPLRHQENESVSSILSLPENQDELEDYSMLFVTDFGNIRRTKATDFLNIKKNGKIAMQLEDDNGNSIGKLVNVILCKDDDDVLIATRKGNAMRISVGDQRVVGSRKSIGVRGITLADDDTVISASLIEDPGTSYEERQAFLAGGTVSLGAKENPQEFSISAERMAEMREMEQVLLTVPSNGYGKRSSAYEFRTINRGGKGMSCMNINKTTGPLMACFPVSEDDGLLLITGSGQTIRTSVKDIRRQGRTTRGVRLFDMEEGQTVVSVARIEATEEE